MSTDNDTTPRPCRICFQRTYHDIRCRLAKGLDSPVLDSEREVAPRPEVRQHHRFVNRPSSDPHHPLCGLKGCGQPRDAAVHSVEPAAADEQETHSTNSGRIHADDNAMTERELARIRARKAAASPEPPRIADPDVEVALAEYVATSDEQPAQAAPELFPPTLTLVPCNCGAPTCKRVGFAEGMFYQGSGFERELAEEVKRRYDRADLAAPRAVWERVLGVAQELRKSHNRTILKEFASTAGCHCAWCEDADEIIAARDAAAAGSPLSDAIKIVEAKRDEWQTESLTYSASAPGKAAQLQHKATAANQLITALKEVK